MLRRRAAISNHLVHPILIFSDALEKGRATLDVPCSLCMYIVRFSYLLGTPTSLYDGGMLTRMFLGALFTSRGYCIE